MVTFSGFPFHVLSALSWSARPYENDNSHGCGPDLFMAFKFSVASISPWPPERKAWPGKLFGKTFLNTRRVAAAVSSGEDFWRDSFPGTTILVFKIMPSV